MDRRQRKHGEWREQELGDYDVVLCIPSCTYTGNPSILQYCGSKKHDACEAVENGGGVGKAGTPVRESGDRRGQEEEGEAQPEHHWQWLRTAQAKGIG